MKKILILVLSIFFLSGCTVKYNIKLDKSLKVDEQISVNEQKSYFDREYEYYEREEAINNIWNNMATQFIEQGYKYTQNASHTGVEINNSYDNFEDYIEKSTIYEQYFEDISYEDNNDIIKIETTGEFYPYVEQDPSKFAIERTTINIEVPYKVIKNNADKVDGNIYTWYIDKKTKDKKIVLHIDKKNISDSNKSIEYMLIFGIIIVVAVIALYVISKVQNNHNSI